VQASVRDHGQVRDGAARGPRGRFDRGERIDDLSGCCRIIARSAAPTSIPESEMFPDN
jgi:hypothetical protein